MSTPIQNPAGIPGSAGQKRSSVASILGLVAGALLVLGSFLTWVSASANASKLETNIASAMGVDASTIAGSAGGDVSYTASGVSDGGDGVITLVAGIAVILLAAVLFRRSGRARVLSALVLLGGLIAAATTLYDLGTISGAKDDAIAAAAPSIEAIGLDRSVFDGVFTVSAGIGLYVCIVGGLLAVIAGILFLARKELPQGPAGGTMAARPDVPGVGPGVLP